MVARGRGVIVNFSSGWGRSTDAEVAPYCASKWAIEGLTQALAQELPSGMAAVPLNPGIIDTAMLRSCFGSSAASHPSPEEWARRAVPFLLALGPRDNGRPLTVPGG
jgi:NAD(P)-dependent dehydrogenase (short-subunit alcohol dehydrogenase family)